MKKRSILDLYQSTKTVFTAKDIALLLQITDKTILKSKIQYFLKTEKLIHIRRGLYGKSKYNQNELATSIYTPAYISFETVLRKEGIIFQHYDSIFVASYLSRELKLNNGNKLIFRKLKNDILYSKEGVIEKNNYFIATKERAFLDMIYLFKDYYFDNLENID